MSLETGEQLRDEGIARAVSPRKALVAVAKKVVEMVGRTKKFVSMDTVRPALAEAGITAELLGPAAGSLFRTKAWRHTGTFMKSEHENNHAHSYPVWEYVGTQGVTPTDALALPDRAKGLCATGRFIDAIRLVRQETGLSLKEAKDYVDNLREGKAITLGGSQPS